MQVTKSNRNKHSFLGRVLFPDDSLQKNVFSLRISYSITCFDEPPIPHDDIKCLANKKTDKRSR